MGLVSVVITTYNDSQYLIKTVASCLVQDVDAQIVVVDDCSAEKMSDTTMNFLYAAGCHVLWHNKNKGLAEARDTGIRYANCEYILPLDTMDWCWPHVLGSMVKAMKDADVVYGNMDERDGEPICPPPGANGITRDNMMVMNQLWCSSMFRKSLWEKVGGYRNCFHTSYEDYFFFNKCVMAGARFKYLNLLIYRHTPNENSMLSKLNKNTDFYNDLARKPLM
jgi:glycosyltransferase involved in cell wall biosynthesis